MKNKRFKKNVQNVLLIITMMLGIMLVSVDDFELRAIPNLLLLWSIFIWLCYLLKKYGRNINV